MESRAKTRYQDASRHARSLSGERERMSYWRWLLFAAMARLEAREAKYLRIPNATTIRRAVPMKVDTAFHECSAMDQGVEVLPGDRVEYAERDGRCARAKFASWLPRMWRRRSRTR
jgi:hypothetical protein